MALTIVRNQGLGDAATSTQTSNICEPTAAANGTQLMMTGNWFASASTNGGTNWSHVDPFTRFPFAAGGFCCDQVVLYNSQHRIWIWLLQYSQLGSGNNIFRLAVCKDTSFGNWLFWDFSPRDLNASWTTTWFDYPDMACTSQNLWVTFNAFIGNAWQRAVVFKMPLATLAAGGALSYNWWNTTANGSLRLCRGAGSTMYMGSHNTLSQLRVLQWSDAGTTISAKNVNVRAWSAGAYSAPGPGNVNWLGRADPRITGAWVGGGQIGFMWTANRDSNHPLPYVRVVRLNASTKALIDEPDLWSNSGAWAYPAAAVNSAGVVGFSAAFGGGTKHPGHAIGVKTASGWSTALTKVSTHGPTNQSWGDYLSCVPHHSTTTNFVAAGYTLQGGTARQNIEPRYVQFRP